MFRRGGQGGTSSQNMVVDVCEQTFPRQNSPFPCHPRFREDDKEGRAYRKTEWLQLARGSEKTAVLQPGSSGISLPMIYLARLSPFKVFRPRSSARGMPYGRRVNFANFVKRGRQVSRCESVAGKGNR